MIVVIIFAIILQTDINVIMLSIGGQGDVRLPLKYMQTRVCRNSYMTTQTVPDSYLCLREYSLTTVEVKTPKVNWMPFPSLSK